MSGDFWEPTAVRLTWALAHFLWQGAVLWVALALVLRVWQSATAPQRYALSLGTLALMCASPVATFLLLDSAPAALGASATGRELVASAAAEAPAASDSLTIQVSQPAAWADPAGWLFRFQPQLLWMWLTGVVLLGVRLLTAGAATIWLRGARVPLSAPLEAQLAGLGRRMQIDVAARVFGTARVAEAVAVGLWRPVVLVPLSWLTELPPDMLEAVIAHELAHIRRWDLWATLLQRVIETLLFYHPVVWWVSRQATIERELCCDQWAVALTGKRVAYAKALETLGQRAHAEWLLSLSPSFRGEARMNLLLRVRHVLGLRREAESQLAWPVGVTALALAAVVWAMSSGTRPTLAEEGRPPVPRQGEGARRPEGGQQYPLGGDFRPQTPREAALMQIILQLQQEMALLRQQVAQIRGGMPNTGPVRPGEGAAKPGLRDGEGALKPGLRDGQVPKTGPRDGEGAPKVGLRDGEGAPKVGPRDGEGAPKLPVPRERD